MNPRSGHCDIGITYTILDGYELRIFSTAEGGLKGYLRRPYEAVIAVLEADTAEQQILDAARIVRGLAAQIEDAVERFIDEATR